MRPRARSTRHILILDPLISTSWKAVLTIAVAQLAPAIGSMSRRVRFMTLPPIRWIPSTWRTSTDRSRFTNLTAASGESSTGVRCRPWPTALRRAARLLDQASRREACSKEGDDGYRIFRTWNRRTNDGGLGPADCGHGGTAGLCEYKGPRARRAAGEVWLEVSVFCW